MNTSRIIGAAKDIEKRELALKWLTEHGVRLDATPSTNEVKVEVTLYFAGSCEGAPEAKKVIEAYARIALPDAINAAIQCCQNDIVMARDAIREELDK